MMMMLSTFGDDDTFFGKVFSRVVSLSIYVLCIFGKERVGDIFVL